MYQVELHPENWMGSDGHDGGSGLLPPPLLAKSEFFEIKTASRGDSATTSTPVGVPLLVLSSG